jgi:ATP-dependent RNA helicase RhlE
MSHKSSHGFGAGVDPSGKRSSSKKRRPARRESEGQKPTEERESTAGGFGAGVSGASGKQPRAERSSQTPQRKQRGPKRRREQREERREERESRQAAPAADPVEAYLDKIADETPEGGDSFERFRLGKRIMRGIADAGYTAPRPIQRDSIQPILEGDDILGLAQTGTGKTAAFVLPILHRLLEAGKPTGFPRILVVSPTRELTNQIHQEFLALGKYTGVKSMTVFGGVSQAPQKRAIATRPEVVVACPGRLLDLVNQGLLNLKHVEVLVLDEADHMFDMGFLPDVRRILKALPRNRQNLLFSATMPKEIRKLTKEVLNDPVVVELNHHAPIETIEHMLLPVHPTRKGDLLQETICDDDFRTAIVFTRTKYRAKSLAQKLVKHGHRAVALQGNMSQPQRDRAMAGFKNGTFEILVATDIAARGIDVAGVSHVINYDIPNTPEAYMHRIGRTGRSEREGKALTFVTHEDFPQVKAIEKKLGMEITRLKLKDFAVGTKGGDDLARKGGGGGGGAYRGHKSAKTGGRGVRGQANKRRGGHRRGR